MTSRIPGFYGWSLEARRAHLRAAGALDDDAFRDLNPESLSLDRSDKLIENVIGVLGLPIGLGLNLTVNGEDVLVPMVVEEPSIVAAFSHAAKMARHFGGVEADADPSHMIAQVQMSAPNATVAAEATHKIDANRVVIEAKARSVTTNMEARGGGFRRLDIRQITDPEGGPPMIVLHVIVDVLEAMGANVVNRVAEAVGQVVQEISGLRVNLRILSNLATERLARARVRIRLSDVGGADIAARIADADRFARLDPYRAATHNKGILNGIDAVALATGNDWRSIEAGAHAYAARSGQYRGLTRWEVIGDHLHGAIELPIAVGTVGGTTQSHPTIARLRALMNIRSAQHLASILAAVGLIQNLGALRALADEGIQRGHMALHARQIALALGAEPDEVDAVVSHTVAARDATPAAVQAALEAHRRGSVPMRRPSQA